MRLGKRRDTRRNKEKSNRFLGKKRESLPSQNYRIQKVFSFWCLPVSIELCLQRMFVSQSVRLFVSLPIYSIHPSIHPSLCLSTCLSISIFVFLWLPIYLPACLTACLHLSACLPLSVCLSVCLSPCLCLSICLSACLPACLPLPVCPFITVTLVTLPCN